MRNKHLGIRVHKKIEIEILNKQEKKLLGKILEILIIFFSVVSMIFCFISGLDIMIMRNLLLIGVAIQTIVLYTIFSFKQQIKYMVPLIIISYFLALYIYISEIIVGFHFVANRYIEVFNDYYNTEVSVFLIKVGGESYYTTVFFLFLLGLFIGIITFSISYRWNRFIYLSTTLPIVALSILVGVLPNYKYFAMYIILLIGVMGGQKFKNNQSQKSVRIKVCCILVGISWILFVLGSFFFSLDLYKKHIDVKEVKLSIQSEFTEIGKGNWDFFSKSKASGGLNKGELGQVDEIIFKNETALRIKLSEQSDNKIYLRGYVGSVYNENRWEPLSQKHKKKYEEIERKSIDYGICMENMWELSSNEITNFDFTMEIENVNAGENMFYVPYSSLEDISLNEKGEILLGGIEENRNYKISYYNKTNELYEFLLASEQINLSGVDDILKTLELEYRDFVYDIYTQIPKERSLAVNLFEKKDLPIDIDTLFYAIEEVTDYLKSNTNYSLSPGALPRGEDFVDYFLFKSKKGYCSHYASAATILFRSMGIPARYVEGYVVNKRDFEKESENKSIDIKDNNAHAWVEVYVNGYGWMPVETTPGYTGESQVPQAILDQINKSNLNKDNSKLKEKPIKTVEPTKQPLAPILEKPTKDITSSSGKELIEEAIIKLLKVVGSIVIIFVIIAVGTLLRRKIISRKHEKILRSKNFNKKAIFMYKEVEKINFVEKKYFERFSEIVLKASYSEGWITEEEFKEVVKFYLTFKNEVYTNCTKKQKIYVKYILVL